MHSSGREAKLQALLSDHSEVRERVGELAKTYENILAEDVRGTRLAHMVGTTQRLDIAFDETRLRDSNLTDAMLVLLAYFLNRKRRETIYHTSGSLGKILSPRAKVLEKFSLRGVQYSTAGSRTRNSHVHFRLPQMDASESLAHPEAAQITDIFLHSQVSALEAREDERRSRHPHIYLCIRPYLPLRPELRDIDESYRKFGFAGGYLSERALGAPIVVDHSSIISHVAVTPMEIREYEVLHVLPMDRVSFHSAIRRKNLTARN